MTTALAERAIQPSATAIEKVLIGGDLSALTPEQRVSYYNSVCSSLGLNPLTKPFAYLKLSGKETLYALRDAAEQLRKINGVSITGITTQHFNDVYIVTATAQDKTGRQDVSTGVVPLGSLKGENLANALMKAETKAKRRVTLSICGLGMLDETEVESIPGATTKPSYVVEAPTAPARLPAGSGDPAAATGENGGTSEWSGFDRDDHAPDLGVDRDPKGLYIERVEKKPTRNPNVTKYTVVLSDGRECGTIRDKLASLAEQLCQDRVAVQVTTTHGKYGEDLLTLAPDEESVF